MNETEREVQVNFRCSEVLRIELGQAARASRRSVNSEILIRLERDLNAFPASDGVAA